MPAHRYDIALIPCTKTKNPVGVTPATLYKGGPFSLMMQHAQQRCDRIVIMSAKFGLLKMDDRVHDYEAYLPALTEGERTKLEYLMRIQAERLDGGSICSYLSKAYYDFLADCVPLETMARVRRPYRKLPMLTLYRVLSNEIKGYEAGYARR